MGRDRSAPTCSGTRPSSPTDYLASLDTRPVGRPVDLAALRAAMGGPLPDGPTDPAAVVDALAAAADPGLVASAGSALLRVRDRRQPAGRPRRRLADRAPGTRTPACTRISPAAAVAEEVAGAWLVELLGLPAGTSVGFVTGATMANFTALAAARHGVLREVGWDVERHGLQGAPPVTVVTHDGTHVTVYASLQMLGLGREGERVRMVAADDQGRMRPRRCATTLATIDGPIIVCAQAGNVNTGRLRPVRRRSSRSPTSAAPGSTSMGRSASGPRPCRRCATVMRGYEGADSWSTDAHKWLNVPYDSGLVFVRDAAAHHAAMTLGAAYYIETAGVGARQLQLGARIVAAGPRVHASSRRCGRWVGPGWSTSSSATARSRDGWPSGSRGGAAACAILNDVVLNQVLVRFDGADDDADGSAGDARTRGVIDGVQRDGTCWLGGTDLGRPRRDARLGLRLADDRGRHRPLGGGHPARARRGRRRGRGDGSASRRPSSTSRCGGRP